MSFYEDIEQCTRNNQEWRIVTYSHHTDLIFLTQVSQYLSITVACSTLKQAVCVATLPQYTQNFIFLSDSFVKPSTYCNVFTSISPHLIWLDLHIVNAEFSKNFYHHSVIKRHIKELCPLYNDFYFYLTIKSLVYGYWRSTELISNRFLDKVGS